MALREDDMLQSFTERLKREIEAPIKLRGFDSGCFAIPPSSHTLVLLSLLLRPRKRS